MAKRRRIDRAVSNAEKFRLVTVKRGGRDLDVGKEEATVGMLSQAALAHGVGRNGRVAQVLCYMALIRQPGRRRRPLAPVPVVECVKADPQHFSARRAYDQQAAHWLPGTIEIDTVFCWTYLADPGTARALELLFGDVNPLSSNFNKADSAAEGSGLADAFAEACRRVLVAGGDPREDVRQAYRQGWVPRARDAYFAAIEQKRAKPQVPDLMRDEWGNVLNLAERGAALADPDIRNVHEQISVLDYYVATLDGEPPELGQDKMRQILG